MNDIIDGRYRVHQLIGQGGMAAVYKVWNNDSQRYEALKVLSPHIAGDSAFVERFLKEARDAARLQHPNIATVYAVSGADVPQPYFTMDLLEGYDLAELIYQRGRLSLEESLPILRQIASALDYAHSLYLIHRDIKPSNILLEDDGRGDWKVKVVNFGIAKAQANASGTRLTKSGMIVGTPEYMSPEQAQTPDLVNKRSDIYSFGILVYEMLTGKPPFKSQQDTSPISVLLKHVQEEPAPPIQAAPNLSSKANKAILQVLSKNPLDRFDSCEEFVAALSPTVEKYSFLSKVLSPPVLLVKVLLGIDCRT